MNDEQKKLIKTLQQTFEIQDGFLKGLERANQVAPAVQQAREITEWQIRTISDLPENIPEFPYRELQDKAASALAFWQGNLPSIPVPSDHITTSGSAETGTAGTAVFDTITSVGEISGPSAQLWAGKYAGEYIAMQEKQNRIDDVRSRIEKINPGRVEEFDEAVNTYRSAIVAVNTRKEAGTAMRNVLDHVKGDLWEKAKMHPGEQASKNKMWKFIAERLVVGGATGTQSKLLLDEEDNRQRIWTKLSNITHNSEGEVKTDLKVIFTDWIDHLYRTLILIDLKHFS